VYLAVEMFRQRERMQSPFQPPRYIAAQILFDSLNGGGVQQNWDDVVLPKGEQIVPFAIAGGYHVVARSAIRAD
jgi:hypothetical protein